MYVINKRHNCPKSLRLDQKRQEIPSNENIGFKSDSNFNRKVWVPRIPVNRGIDVVASLRIGIKERTLSAVGNGIQRPEDGYYCQEKTKKGTQKCIKH